METIVEHNQGYGMAWAIESSRQVDTVNNRRTQLTTSGRKTYLQSCHDRELKLGGSSGGGPLPRMR